MSGTLHWTAQYNLVNSKLYNSIFHIISNVSMNLNPKQKKKIIHTYLVISKTKIIHDSKENMSCSDNFHTVFPKIIQNDNKKSSKQNLPT
jgi:hypothetical protein